MSLVVKTLVVKTLVVKTLVVKTLVVERQVPCPFITRLTLHVSINPKP
jgi:hypothetical protein